jgi:glucokinase
MQKCPIFVPSAEADQMIPSKKISPLPVLLAGAQSGARTSTIPQAQTQPEPAPRRQMSAPLVIGVDLGGTQTRAAVVRGHEIVARTSQRTPAAEGPSAVIATIVATIHEVMEQAEISLKDIRGIGVGAPGPLDSRTGVVFDAPNLHGWHNIPLGAELAQSFAVPISVGHDANLAGLAEFRFGAGRGTSDMIYMTVSTGIGGGIIIDGKIVEGVSGTAGEVGHMYLDLRPDAPHDGVGHQGCLEALASGTAIARDANALIAAGQGQGILAVHAALVAENPDAERAATSQSLAGGTGQAVISARDVVEAAQRGDAEALTIVQKAATNIGAGCVNLIHILNPEVIVIGGSVAQHGWQLMIGTIEAVITGRAFARPAQAVRILPSELGDDVGLIGAAAFVDYQATIDR